MARRKALAALESIISEEDAFVRTIDEEAEKNRAAAAMMVDGQMDASEAIALQRDVIVVMRRALKMQLVLQDKLERFLEDYCKDRDRGQTGAAPSRYKIGVKTIGSSSTRKQG